MNFSISEFAQSIRGHFLENNITIIKLDSANNALFNSIIEDQILSRTRMNISMSIFVLAGEAVATLDYKTYNATKNNLLGILPFKILTQLHVSPDFAGYIMIFSKNLIEEASFNRKPPVSLSQILTTDRNSVKQLSATEMTVMTTCLERVYYYLKYEEHRLRKDLIINTFYTFILEAANIIFNNEPQVSQAEKSIKKTYIQNFIELLIKHAEKEHNPSFYADKLCISVQYLSLILKEVSGRTANAWIASYIITIAKTMLRKPDMTIQQITENLNFSDQSSFGKFFKKHVGISPKKYREAHLSY